MWNFLNIKVLFYGIKIHTFEISLLCYKTKMSLKKSHFNQKYFYQYVVIVVIFLRIGLQFLHLYNFLCLMYENYYLNLAKNCLKC